MFIALGAHELGKIHVGEQFGFDVIDAFLQGVDELVKVFFVEKQFMLFVGESFALRLPSTFGNGNIIVVGARGLDIEKIRPFARSNPFGIDFILLSFVHNQ